MRFFSINGVFRHSLHITDNEESMDKQYEISYPAIARYFHTHFGSGVRSMQLIMDKGLTDRPLPGEFHCIENQRASLVYWFESGSHVGFSSLSLQGTATGELTEYSWFQPARFVCSLTTNKRWNCSSSSPRATRSTFPENRSLKRPSQLTCG